MIRKCYGTISLLNAGANVFIVLPEYIIDLAQLEEIYEDIPEL